MGLGLLGPGEFVHRQIDLEPQVPNSVNNALVGQGEGVEGAGEEGDPLGLLEGEGAAVQPADGDKTVDVGQGGGPVEQGQPVPAGGLLRQVEQLPVAQSEQPGLLPHVQDGAFKQ